MKTHHIESSTLELKETYPEKSQILKTCVAFCNAHGGRIMIGVRDDGTIRGVAESLIHETMEFVNKQVFDSCSPPIIPQVYTTVIDEKYILIIEVSGGMNKPYFLTKSGMGNGTYVRIGRSTMKANAELIEELQWQSRSISFDSLPCYQSELKHLDAESLEVLFKEKKLSRVSEQKTLLESLSLLVKEHGKEYVSQAGILLFSKTPEVFNSEAFIICSRFKGNEGRDAIESIDVNGPLSTQIELAVQFILSHIGVSYSITGTKRLENPIIPEVAIRETVINAVVHRNYHTRAPIKIAVYNNRVEIFSPGGFPSPIATSDFNIGISHVRNLIITKVMRQLGYVEKLGSGLKTILESCARERLISPEIIDGGAYTKVILYKGHVEEPISKDEELHAILYFIQKNDDSSTGSIMENLGISRTTIVRKLKILLDQGLIKKKGQGRSVRYCQD